MNFSTTITVTDIATIFLALGTLISLVYISRQVAVTRKQAKGEFLLALDAQIEKVRPIASRVLNEEGFKPNGDDWLQIWGLMSIYERISIMLDDQILDTPMIVRLYAFMLRALIANDDIFQRIQQTGAEWQDFIKLCYTIADYQEHKGPNAQEKAFIERVHKLNKDARRLNNPWRF